MKLTPFAKVVLTLVVLVVVGVAVNKFYGPQLRTWATGQATAGGGGTTAGGGNAVDKNDFNDLGGGMTDPAHNAAVTGVQSGNVGAGKLSRTLYVGINTW